MLRFARIEAMIGEFFSPFIPWQIECLELVDTLNITIEINASAALVGIRRRNVEADQITIVTHSVDVRHQLCHRSGNHGRVRSN